MDTANPCPFCGGSGQCARCGGAGTRPSRTKWFHFKTRVLCPACQGKGQCQLCLGRGTVDEKRS